MKREIIEIINQEVFTQFPYLEGVEPTVQAQPGEKSLLLYKGSSLTADGHVLPILVRVVADATGSILKLTSSR